MLLWLPKGAGGESVPEIKGLRAVAAALVAHHEGLFRKELGSNELA